MNDLLAAMSAHRSVRAYLPTPVPDDHIRAAVTSAQQAATSSWIQAYSLLQIRDAAVRERLAEWTGGQPQVEQSGALFAVCADIRRHRLVASRAGQPYAGNLESFLLAVVDASLFAQNLCLAFESMGYGTCFIGGLRTRLPEVDALLEIPDGVWPLFGLCVGQPDPAVPSAPRPRLPAEAVWMQDRYLEDDAMLAHVDAYDVQAQAHYAERGRAGRTWSGGLWRKFVKPMRAHLRAYYTSKGARLD
jgi:FMN reductase (NADPH)